MDLVGAAVMATVTTLFVLGLVVSRYFALAAVVTLALVLFSEPVRRVCVAYFPPLRAAEAEQNITNPLQGEAQNDPVFEAIPIPATTTQPSTADYIRDGFTEGVTMRDDTLETIPRLEDSEDREETAALRRIEAARESFERLDVEDASTWGQAQDGFIREYRLNNMGDDTNTVTYIHPDYADRYASKEQDIWGEDMDRLRAFRTR